MTFDELHDEYTRLTREILEQTKVPCVIEDYDEQCLYEVNLKRLQLRFNVIIQLLDRLASVCDDHHQELLDDIFPPKNKKKKKEHKPLIAYIDKFKKDDDKE